MTMPSAPTNSLPRWAKIGIAAIFAGQFAMLALAAWRCRYQINFDGCCYLRVATYYARGQWELAVSTYWGPMLSWIMALPMRVVSGPLPCGRFAMAVSAVVFLGGCVAALRQLGLRPATTVAAALAAATASVSWSVNIITPDLLMAGFALLGFARLLSPNWTTSAAIQLAAGACFGLAFLVKPVALPLFVLMLAALSVNGAICRNESLWRLPRPVAMTTLCFLLFAAPWIAAISHKQGRLTFPTSAKISYAIVAPGQNGQHPEVFMDVAPGRIYVDETDNEQLPYCKWSPLESTANLVHQLKLLVKNSGAQAGFLADFDWLHLGLASLVLGFVTRLPWHEDWKRQRWRWGVIPVFVACAVYVPGYAIQPRYYLLSMPFLFAAAAGMADWLTAECQEGRRWRRALAMLVVVASFVLPNVVEAGFHMRQRHIEPSWLRVARYLREHDLPGGIAGHNGAYVALIAERPFIGDVTTASPDDYVACGARTVVAERGSPLAKDLDGDRRFQRLNDISRGFLRDPLDEKSELNAYRVVPKR